MATQSRPDQMQKLLERAPEGSLFMLNLLKFRELAVYADGRETDLTGAEAYSLYGRGVARLITDLGGSIIWGGMTNSLVIGEGDAPDWDQVAVVEYPNITAFTTMTASPAYQQIHIHREAGLDQQLLINCLSAGQARAIAGLKE